MLGLALERCSDGPSAATISDPRNPASASPQPPTAKTRTLERRVDDQGGLLSARHLPQFSRRLHGLLQASIKRVQCWRWRYRDAQLGCIRRTTALLTEEEAAAYPEAERIDGTLSLREVDADLGENFAGFAGTSSAQSQRLMSVGAAGGPEPGLARVETRWPTPLEQANDGLEARGERKPVDESCGTRPA
jgi:hypothetical protein